MRMPTGRVWRRAGLAVLLSLAVLRAWSPLFADESLTVAPGSDGIQRATIILDSYSYAPNHLVVQAGKPVELILRSVTTLTPHNFLITDPEAGFRVEQDVGAGKTATVTFTPMHPGTYAFYCDKKLLFFASHREKGMEGRLDVR